MKKCLLTTLIVTLFSIVSNAQVFKYRAIRFSDMEKENVKSNILVVMDTGKLKYTIYTNPVQELSIIKFTKDEDPDLITVQCVDNYGKQCFASFRTLKYPKEYKYTFMVVYANATFFYGMNKY